MKQKHIPYSFKNMLLPNKHQYKLALINKLESFCHKISDRKHTFSYNFQTRSEDIEKHYGFKTYKHSIIFKI